MNIQPLGSDVTDSPLDANLLDVNLLDPKTIERAESDYAHSVILSLELCSRCALVTECAHSGWRAVGFYVDFGCVIYVPVYLCWRCLSHG